MTDASDRRRALADRAGDVQFCAGDLIRPTPGNDHAHWLDDRRPHAHSHRRLRSSRHRRRARFRCRFRASPRRARPYSSDGHRPHLRPATRRPRALARARDLRPPPGGALGMAGLPVPFVELGIAISVIVLGAIVAFARKAPVAIAVGIVGLFAIFHGHAHGTEMPLDATGGTYAAGFMLATALLHVAG